MLSKIQLAEKNIQPLEAIVSFYYRQHPEMHDYDALRAVETLLKYIRAKLTNYPLPQNDLKGIAKILYDEQYQFLNKIQKSHPLEEIQLCLKQLEKSLKFWSKEQGSRGYFNFISNFT